VSFADTSLTQHYLTPPPFDSEEHFNPKEPAETIEEGLRVKVTTPRLKRVMLAEDPTASSQTQGIDTDDEDQGQFVELMYNLIYLSSENVCGKLG